MRETSPKDKKAETVWEVAPKEAVQGTPRQSGTDRDSQQVKDAGHDGARALANPQSGFGLLHEPVGYLLSDRPPMRGETTGSLRGSVPSEEGFLLGLLHVAFKLTFVGGTIEVALRLGYESIISKLPLLKAADANPLSGPARPSVGADKCPVVYSTVPLNEEVVHEYLHCTLGRATTPSRGASTCLIGRAAT